MKRKLRSEIVDLIEKEVDHSRFSYWNIEFKDEVTRQIEQALRFYCASSGGNLNWTSISYSDLFTTILNYLKIKVEVKEISKERKVTAKRTRAKCK